MGIEDVLTIRGGLAESSDEITELVRKARLHSRPFINGNFVEPLTDSYIENISPVNGAVINEVASCGVADVDRAVTAARSAFEDGRWAAIAPAERKKKLLRFAELIEKNADELAALDALDVGKPFEAARSVDVPSATTTVRWFAEAVDKIYGEVAPTATLDVIVRQPLGVVAAIVPWNYPLMIAAWKFGPILAAGNSLILKPAEQSPLSALRVAELATEAGIPDGVFNVIPGLGASAGAALGRHAGVDGIAFTGSTEVGKRFFEYSSQSNIKNISLECGGKSPCVIAEDADLENAITKTASGLFYNAGQSCNAPTRVLVHESLSKKAIDLLIIEAKKYYPDNPFRKGTKVGAIVSAEQLARISKLVQSGVKDGAMLVSGGKSCFEKSNGFYFEPTVIANAETKMDISQEEVFGPVIPVQTFRSIDEAVQLANATRYGLWANVWTRSLDTAVLLCRKINAGTVAVNNVFGGDITTPFGGFKESGTGRDRSLHALEKYTQLKHMHFNL